MNRIAIAAAGCALFAASSCALLLQGTTEQVAVMSEPSDATVTMNSGETHVTPFTITVPRRQDLQFHFSKPGYQSADITDNSQVEGGYLVADFPLMFLGWGIDAASGAYFKHQQSAVVAHLDPLETAAPEASGNSQPTSAQVKPSVIVEGK